MTPSLSRPDYYDFNERLRLEEENKYRAELLFGAHKLDDISSDEADRKSGTDFLLTLLNSDGSESGPIRCENKFEQYYSGRVTLEMVSVDTRRTPGWMFTSRTGWLLSWFANAGDLLACPMGELRDLVMTDIARNQSTTCKNKTYMSWSSLEDINYLLLNVKNSRVLDLRYELGDKPPHPSQVSAAAGHKFCKSEELVELMRTLPFSSEPLAVTSPELEAVMRKLAPKNRKARDHADRLSQIPFLRPSHGQ